MSLSEIPDSKVEKNRRIPNAFMLFVKEQKKMLLKNFPNESKDAIAALQGKIWRSLSVEEKEVYYEKYRALKKLKADKYDSNLTAETKITDNENIDKSAVNEFTIHTNSNKLDVIAEPNQQLNKQTLEELQDNTFNKSKVFPNSLSNKIVSDKLSLNLVEKQKPLKKVRRPPNAFICFAKEQRSNIDLSIKKDKKCHINSILGSMWRELSNSEKAKYYQESRRQLKLYKQLQTTTPSKIVKKKSKLLLKKDLKKTVQRSSKKKVEFLPGNSFEIASHQMDVPEKSLTESDSKKPIVETSKVESTESAQASSEPLPHVSNEYDSSSLHQQHNVTKNPFHRKIPPTEAHHSNPCCCPSTLSQNYNNNCTLNRYSPFDSSMSTSCFGAGSFPPFFPSYPPFLMYQHQQAMSHHMHPFQQPSFFPSLCSCCSLPPYPFNSPYSNTYLNTYSSLCAGPFPYAPRPSSSATTACAAAIREEDSAEITETAENSDTELLIVDEKDTDGGLNPKNAAP